MSLNNNPIGFFDSGIGGLSVLKEAIKILPNENFIYYGDSKNAPYGIKSNEDISKLVENVVNFLLKKHVKAIVVACNTATSVAVEQLRKELTIPVIGIEPALKPAVNFNEKGKIVIMATPVTLKEKKFNNLMNDYGKDRTIVQMPCPELVELIESGIICGKEVEEYLKNKLEEYNLMDKNKTCSYFSSIVLGCTHYPFIKNQLQSIVGEKVHIIDGGIGTAKQLKRQLTNRGLLNNRENKGDIKIYNSLNKDEIIKLSYKLLNL